MRSKDQEKYLDSLKRYEKKFDAKELFDYKMFVKRHKDDEDLDNISMGKLKDMYVKYHVNRERRTYDVTFKKKEEEE
ncbi:MAG: hypothetical protein V1720_15325 [bacterium]